MQTAWIRDDDAKISVCHFGSGCNRSTGEAAFDTMLYRVFDKGLKKHARQEGLRGSFRDRGLNMKALSKPDFFNAQVFVHHGEFFRERNEFGGVGL